jgi:hypothetical protein
MNADARHGDVRPERCLPTGFHSRLPKSSAIQVRCK